MGEITYTDHVRDNVGSQASNPEAARLKVYCLTLCDLLDRLTVEVDRLADEVDRLRAENTALAAVLADIAGITYSPAHEVYVNGECHRFQDPPCHEADPTDPEDWCVTCVAEVAWSAWKMGVLA